MKKVSLVNYKQDILYPKVVKATARLLQTSDEVSPVAILRQMGLLELAEDAGLTDLAAYITRAETLDSRRF